jgi:hypothetical protein
MGQAPIAFWSLSVCSGYVSLSRRDVGQQVTHAIIKRSGNFGRSVFERETHILRKSDVRKRGDDVEVSCGIASLIPAPRWRTSVADRI